jgi:hypothetical protein
VSYIISIQVKLKDIIEEMEIQFEESRSLLNITTGEIVLVTSEDLRVPPFPYHPRPLPSTIAERLDQLIRYLSRETISPIL